LLADPTEILVTLATRHLIAATDLLRGRFATGTRPELHRVRLSILLKNEVWLLALVVSGHLLAARETNRVLAGLTPDKLLTTPRFAQYFVAIWHRAVHAVVGCSDLVVLVDLLELSNQCFGHFQFFKSLDCEQVATAILKANEFMFHLLQAFLNVLKGAVGAKYVLLALWQTIEVFFKVIIATDIAELCT
jgi:hypothetical protein